MAVRKQRKFEMGRVANKRELQLAMATLGTLFTGTWAMMGGSKKEQAKQGPPINASSKDEENFIQYAFRSSIMTSRIEA